MRLDLNGKWQMRAAGSKDWLPAAVPGCNYTDLMDNDIISDPFLSDNEQNVLWVGEKDWEYQREFIVDNELYEEEHIELIAESLDTLATVFINNQVVLSANNAHREYTVDIKPYIILGVNVITIMFLSPVNYIKDAQKIHKYPHNGMGLAGVPHIRKNQSHFGWDWGPILPLSGITKNIFIKAYSIAVISDVRVMQEHYQNRVKLDIDINAFVVDKSYDIKAHINLTAPDGRVSTYFEDLTEGNALCSIDLMNPDLWEANGMTDRIKQPLYQLEVSIKYEDKVIDVKRLNVGLRTITLNTSSDKWGNTFQFIVNGIPIFSRGANWIPADSFPARLTRDRIDYLVRSARDANMNMIRVWGGGFYESEDFYDACDRYGILVWQDFGFACMPYDFDNAEFIKNVQAEVITNIIRLRNRTSLALWCGNNEIELLSKLWMHRRNFIRSTGEFFYKILAEWVNIWDGNTQYWPGSPSSGEYMKKVNSDDIGDTHLWQVWHGLKPYNYYRKRFTRFCSEFGFESLPDIETIEGFNDTGDYSLNSKVMLSHQKCKSGNNKILFYLTDRFRIPERFEDLVYLSQLSQMECVRDATEHWRRNMQRCNGSLFWQLNDCWPVSSWSSIDYWGRWKALQYAARRFNAPIALSIDDKGSQMNVSITNDTIEHWVGAFNWSVKSFKGDVLDSGTIDINAKPLSSELLFTKDFRDMMDKDTMRSAVFTVQLNDDQMSIRTSLFVKEKNARFIKPVIDKNVEVQGNRAIIRLQSDVYSRYVMVKVKGVNTPLSDNYFDLMPNVAKTIECEIDKNLTADQIEISIKSLADCKPKGSRIKDNLLRLYIRVIPINIIYAIGQIFS